MNFDLEEQVRQRAYEIWECEGRPNGRECEHWNQATQELSLNRLAVPKAEAAPEAARPVQTPKTRSAKTKAPAKPSRQSARPRQATLN